MGLQDHMITPFLVFKEISMLFCIVAAPVYIPTNSVGRFPFLTPSPTNYYLWTFNDVHSDPWELVSHCYFDLHSFNNWQC